MRRQIKRVGSTDQCDAPVGQHGFYAEAFGTLSNFGNAGWPWYNFRNSGIARFIQGGVIKTFRCATQSIVIQPKVQHICPNDFDGWSAFERYDSADPYDDFSWFTLTIGLAGEEAGNNFQVCVATPRAVSRVRLTGHMPGILVNRFDADTVGRAIRDRVSSIQAHAWFQVVDQLREFMHWEYEGM